MKILLLIALAYAVEEIDPAKILSAEKDLNCFLNHHVDACKAKTSKDGASDGDRPYLELACLDAKDPQSCAMLGHWYSVHNQPEKADSYFSQACDMNGQQGCSQLLRVQIEHLNTSRTKDSLKESLQKAQAMYDRVCAKASELAGQCRVLTSKIEESKKALDFKSCEFAYSLLESDNRPPIQGRVQQALQISKTECLSFCKKSMSEIKLNEGTLRARGQCLYDAQSLGEATWRDGRRDAQCMLEKRIDFDDEAYFTQCYCEQQDHRRFNEIASSFGIYAAPETSKYKTLGKVKWYHCAVGFHYVNPPEARKDQKVCLSVLKSFADKVKGAWGNGRFDFNFNDLKCDGPVIGKANP